MNHEQKTRFLSVALKVIGIVFFSLYPLGILWPAGFVWHGGEGAYYLQMIIVVYAVLGGFLIAAAKEPKENRSLILFTVFSSIAHAGVMAIQAVMDKHEHVHLIGDVPALLLVALILWVLRPNPLRAQD